MEVYEGGKPRQQVPEIPPGFIKKTIIGVVLLLVLFLGFTMFYTLEEQEKAIILTFGKYTKEEDQAGLKIKLPYPIQKVVKYPAKITQEIHIGYRMVNGEVVPLENEALMITGDENLVSADAVVEWNVADMRNFFYNIDDPETFLRNAATAAIRSVIGANRLDFAITEGKTVIQGEALQKLREMNELYQTGIHIVDLKFQDIEPPGGEVQQAFREVTNAREEKNTKINEANRYVNQRLPLARGEARALIEQAQAEKQSRILNAQGDVAKFQALYRAYLNNPEITRTRLIVETLEQIYPNAKIIITNEQGETVQYLPLNELLRSSSGGNTSRSPQQPSPQQQPQQQQNQQQQNQQQQEPKQQTDAEGAAQAESAQGGNQS